MNLLYGGGRRDGRVVVHVVINISVMVILWLNHSLLKNDNYFSAY